MRTLQPVMPANRVPLPDALRQHEDDVFERRFVPPKIVAFLNNPAISPYTRAFLLEMSRKPVAEWTLAQAQVVTTLVPTMTELHVSTHTLSEFYEFLGLDPSELFTPQLGKDWQERSTRFDKGNIAAQQRNDCLELSGAGAALDPTQVTLGQLAACSTD